MRIDPTESTQDKTAGAAPSEKIEQLLRSMSLEEKIGQMVQSDLTWKQDIPALIRAGRIGSLLSSHDPEIINQYQKIAVEESRLGIPLLIANDVIHGYRTIFPIPLALSCAWDPDLIEQVAHASAVEATASGTHWNFSPMVDICRDPRWGRVAEGAGEDPFLGSAAAAAWVRGYQSDGLPGGKRLAACVKHFAAYGGAEAGKDYNTVDMSERRLRSDYLPPYQAALQAGAATVMTSFNELNGIPATGNRWLLQELLREEWGFDGVLISDYDAIGELIFHGYAQDHRQAALQSALAGVDIDMMGDAYHFHLADLVRDGQIPEDFIDAAVRRILELKLDLGLFEDPFVEAASTASYLMQPETLELARQAAEASMVLLKNEGGLLPLQPEGKRIALIGPLADERQSLLGSWSCAGRPEETPSLAESLRLALPSGSSLVTARGCEVEGEEPGFESSLAAALEAAAGADLVILAVGETEAMSGEAHSRAHLGLPGRQQELVEAVAAAGKPAVLLLFTGRPLAIPWIAEHIPALLLAWQGGTCTGAAAANLLLGRASPSAKLSICFPRAVGQIPIYYAHKNTGRPAYSQGVTQFNEAHRAVFLDESPKPLFPFGYGLAYTSFAYENLAVETPSLRSDGTLTLTVQVRNSGARAGQEIVQCYVRDLVGSVTRPVKELKGFQKISLEPGESRTVRFEIPAASLGFWDQEMQYRVEPGEFKVWVGPSSEAGLEGSFRVE
jgi:beta-glucosidase